MSWLWIIGWEVRSAFREAVPFRWLRALILLVAACAEIAFLVLVFARPAQTRPPLRLGFLFGFVALNLVLATGAAGAAISAVLARPERPSLLLAPPLPRALLALLPLVPAVVAALCPVTLLLLPFGAVAAQQAPLVALGLFLSGLCALGWASALALFAAAALGQRLGREKGARILRVLSGWLAILALASFRKLVDLHASSAALIAFLLCTPILLPLVWSAAARAFFAVLRGSEPAEVAPEPEWGRPGSARLLLRSMSAPALLLAAPGVALAVSTPALRPVFCGLLAVVLVAAPLDRLLEAELACPDRLRLAPEGGAFRTRLLLRWGGGALLLAIASSAALGWGHWAWLAGVAAAAALVPVTYLFTARLARVAQVALLAAAIGCSALWGA